MKDVLLVVHPKAVLGECWVMVCVNSVTGMYVGCSGHDRASSAPELTERPLAEGQAFPGKLGAARVSPSRRDLCPSLQSTDGSWVTRSPRDGSRSLSL